MLIDEVDNQRPEALRELIQISRTEKELKDRKIQLLSQLSDTEKSQGLLSVVDKLHMAVLENSPDIEALIEEHLTKEEKLLFLDNKNTSFFRGIQLFEKYQEHPVQKSMQKMGCIGRRAIKKQRTPNQHVGKMVQAKEFYELKRKVDILEEISKLHTKEINTMIDLPPYHSEITRSTTKARKVALRRVREANPKLTQQELADLFGVSRVTVNRWLREI